MMFLFVSLQKAFRTGTSTRLDDRVFSMSQLKYQPLVYSMLMIHPALYRVDNLTDEVRAKEAASRWMGSSKKKRRRRNIVFTCLNT